MDDPRTLDNLSTGWVRLHRSLLRSSIWTMPESWFKIAIACMLLANKEPAKWWDGRRTVEIQPGSFVTSEPKLSILTRLTRKQIQGAFRVLERDNFIKVTRDKRWTMISLVNWETYNPSEFDEAQTLRDLLAQVEGQLRHKSGTTEAQLRHINNTLCLSSLQFPVKKQTQKESGNGHNKQIADRFREFWSRYPNQVGEQLACQMWLSVVDDPDEVFAGLDRWLKSEQWKRKVYERPAKWLSQRMWEDNPAPAEENGDEW